MGRDNQPKERQKARDLHRKAAKRQPFERLLIVCEGEKTEPLYLDEIRRAFRLATAHVHVWPSADGTEPLQVVDYAERLFLDGDRAKAIDRRGFDRVIAVFDRDDHATYHPALAKVRALHLAHENDDGEQVTTRARAATSQPHAIGWTPPQHAPRSVRPRRQPTMGASPTPACTPL